MRQALSGQRTNNEQVILFALPGSKHKTNTQEEITCAESTDYLASPITAMACHFLSEIDTFIFHHFVYSLYQLGAASASRADFRPRSLQREAIKQSLYSALL